MKPLRILINCIIFISIFWLPWWLTALFAIIALFIFESYFEIIIFAFILDSLSSMSLSRFYSFQFVATISALIFFGLVELLKRRLRFYS